ncbi:hypothetical protein D1012_14295 [Pseudotabrizicola alkalilacus]|uniref:Uncharacterized protein n=1 Tax=Pseudotabrizicola alkalilacus TaxID=2305252 RepID=A0A411YZZ3_9RHOB|nr:hypothetical protein D1012_14295 [Pseudotabrizicola alkalilacus]
MLRLIGKDFTIDISRAREELGYAPVISPADGRTPHRLPSRSKEPGQSEAGSPSWVFRLYCGGGAAGFSDTFR